MNDTSPPSLAGQLLLAEPSLRDPNFSRSVILLTQHDIGNGAAGYVLNRPLGKTVGDIMDSTDLMALAALPVFIGGPVGTGQLTLVSFYWNETSGALEYGTDLSAAAAREMLNEGWLIRAFVGYSGWTSGQLESELLRRSWITRPAEAQVAEAGAIAQLWRGLLRTMGPWYRLLADMPDDPSLN